jgi:hypothetical protein
MSPAMRTLISAALGALLLAGCASTPAEPPLTAGHPANPDAPAAALPARSRTLALDDSPPPAVLEPMPAMEHGGTDTGMSGTSGTHHHGTSMTEMQHATPATEPGENAAPSAPRWTPATVPATSPTSSAAHEPARDGQAEQPGHARHGGHP